MDGIADIIGPLDYQVSSSVCTSRGDILKYTPKCSDRVHVVEALSTSQDSPLSPGKPIVTNELFFLENQEVNFMNMLRKWKSLRTFFDF
jgi:hypothetical protein